MEITRNPSPSFKYSLNSTICRKSIYDNDFFRKKKELPKEPPEEEKKQNKLNVYI